MADSRITCIDCGAVPATRSVAGETLSECPSCGSLRVSRLALNRLRKMPPTAHPLLAPPPHPPSSDGAASTSVGVKRCPVCRTLLLAHTFGGGNVRVESCEGCDVAFLRRSVLAAIVKEAHEGIEMSDGAKAALHDQRMLAAGDRFTAAEFGLSTAGLVAVLVFFRIVLKVGFSSVTFVGAGVIAIGVLIFLRRAWRRQQTEAAAKMERLEAAELFRLEQKEREEARRESAAPVVESRPVVRSSKPRLCPVCRAKLPGGTTHCAACDSDFG